MTHWYKDVQLQDEMDVAEVHEILQGDYKMSFKFEVIGLSPELNKAVEDKIAERFLDEIPSGSLVESSDCCNAPVATKSNRLREQWEDARKLSLMRIEDSVALCSKCDKWAMNVLTVVLNDDL